jgi:hypothetical protein
MGTIWLSSAFGPNTDAALLKFGFNDDIIPRLRVLTEKYKSTVWASKLMSGKFSMTSEQATYIARALEKDIKLSAVSSSFLILFLLQVLAILAGTIVAQGWVLSHWTDYFLHCLYLCLFCGSAHVILCTN